jgi:predicted RNA-binding Zn-ribbon protein involved in translation (DUF1610 family)
LKALLLYLLIGGFLLLLWSWLQKFTAKMEKALLKTTCAHCGGHIAFLPQSLGQKIPCPHCGESITLEVPGNLKMSCVLCGGHIEFPGHALGQKIPCPHCTKTITLLKPA